MLLLETIKIIIDHVEDHTAGQSKVILCKDKMSRVFYETKDKYFSIGFPFYIEKKNGSYRIYDKNYRVGNRQQKAVYAYKEFFFGKSYEPVFGIHDR